MQEGVSRSTWAMAVALCMVLASIIAPAQAVCKCTMPSGYTYDLSKLGSQKMTTADGAWTYEYIPCQQTACGDKGLVGLCEHLQAIIYNSLGKYVDDCSNWMETAPGKGFLLSFRGGSPNGANQMGSNINFTCDPFDTSFKFRSNEANTMYNFIWNSPLICPVSGPSSSSDGDGAGGLSGGWIFIIVLICATFLYLVGGVLWNKYRLEKSGLELIPNIDFWLAIPGLVKDGCFYSWEKAKALWERFSSRYETV